MELLSIRSCSTSDLTIEQKVLIISTLFYWRRGGDSNPRSAIGGQRFSRPSRSTTPAPLLKCVYPCKNAKVGIDF